MTARAHRLLIPLAAFLACLPLLVQGPSCGHDFDFHLLSWLEASTQLTHGAFPQWAFTPAWNAGEPRFLFYPPLSWLLGALLGLALPWTLVPAALTFICLLTAGFTMHRLASTYLDAPRASLAAVLYLTNPYMLFTACERTAYGELLAAAFIPLLFAAILTPRIRILTIALPIALIWLTNAPAGVMTCYALALLTLIRLINPPCPIHDSSTVMSGLPQKPLSRIRIAALITAGTTLGLALASAYLIPALVEQPQISPQLAVVEGMRIADNFPFHPMPATAGTSVADAALHNAVLHQASLIALALFLAIALAALASRLSSVNLRATSVPSVFVPRFPTLALLTLTTAVLLLLTPFTLPIWNHLPELRFLQFPWRLLALLAPVFALFAARAIPPFRLAALSLLATAVIIPAWHLFRQPCDAEDNVQARVALFHSARGTEATDEYTPADADGDALHPGNPAYWVASSAEAPPPPNATPVQSPTNLTLTLSAPQYLILNRRFYPIWQVLLNGQAVPIVPVRADGLITLQLPAGLNHIELREQRTPDENAGLALTLLSASLALFLWRRQRHA